MSRSERNRLGGCTFQQVCRWKGMVVVVVGGGGINKHKRNEGISKTKTRGKKQSKSK